MHSHVARATPQIAEVQKTHLLGPLYSAWFGWVHMGTGALHWVGSEGPHALGALQCVRLGAPHCVGLRGPHVLGFSCCHGWDLYGTALISVCVIGGFLAEIGFGWKTMASMVVDKISRPVRESHVAQDQPRNAWCDCLCGPQGIKCKNNNSYYTSNINITGGKTIATPLKTKLLVTVVIIEGFWQRCVYGV